MTEIARDVHAVLLPVVSELTVEPWLADLLRGGTRSVIAGESRQEYVQRRMTPERVASETAEDFRGFSAELAATAGAPVLVAVDQEPWGIQRLHDLVPNLPDPTQVMKLAEPTVEELAEEMGRAAREMKVGLFLSPVVDVLAGPNPWLEGRTLPGSVDDVARVAAAFVRGVQRAGVVAVAKHFPGHPSLEADQAIQSISVSAEHWSADDLVPFRRIVEAGVRGIMTGPVVVDAVDPDDPSSTSRVTIERLRDDLGFEGLVVSDDLDSPGTTLGRSLLETALASIRAGADLLLLPGGRELVDLAAAITNEAGVDDTLADRLAEAASRVRATVTAGTAA